MFWRSLWRDFLCGYDLKWSAVLIHSQGIFLTQRTDVIVHLHIRVFVCSHIDKVYLFFQWFILKRIQTSKYLNFSGLCLPIKTVRIGIHVCIECKSKLNKVRLHILKWELSKFPAKVLCNAFLRQSDEHTDTQERAY